NMDAMRDWGHARDYVEAMWGMLQQEMPQDLVIATGEQHSVREFTELAFREVGIDIEWRGEGLDEIGVCRTTGRTLVAVDPVYFRPSEVETLLGDATKARRILGWTPRTSFEELVQEMVAKDWEEAKNQTILTRENEQNALRLAS
ncbi:MAG: GDP-mannose 4,6-dehydratase, partial [Armatimonadetes bacterium]|nr:GDP-mannose 4,6-dehydratase [Armatimonadota bacterium]